jgi:hypothetical protein
MQRQENPAKTAGTQASVLTMDILNHHVIGNTGAAIQWYPRKHCWRHL